MENKEWLSRNHHYTLIDGKSGFTLNVAGMGFTESDLENIAPKFDSVHQEMEKIEAGEIKNPDEHRKVTHFTDRSVYPGTQLFTEVENFASDIRSGNVLGSTGRKISYLVINGIGGSALGPQLMQFAMNGPYWNELSDEKRGGNLKIYFVDNTDSSGLADTLEALELDSSIILSISKSGGTQETKNNLIAFEKAYSDAGIDFAKHACAITMKGSQLDAKARGEGWLRVFEMAESIGGRTSETSVVGHVPAALTGVDFKSFLNGACHMDAWTRNPDYRRNPAYLLAAMWFVAGGGKGDRNMVIVPYSDRMVLLSRYLQQLVMESLGKEKDFDGNRVHQGLNVFGNKGGTDAHAFIQQLNDGRDDFFVTFIEVLKDAMNVPVTEEVTMGDYLHGFQAGLSEALRQKGRQVIQIFVRHLDTYNLGMLVALYERAVAAYAELVHINAFHQPGVQSYKLASKSVIQLLLDLQKRLPELDGFEGTSYAIAKKLGLETQAIEVTGILAKFAENADQRTFQGFTISRCWSKDCGWSYSIKAVN